LFKEVQPQDQYEWALTTLTNAKRLDPLVLTKSGIMVGLGETIEEVLEVMHDLAQCGVDILTVGQYLAPGKQYLPIRRYYTPEEFDLIRDRGLEMGFKWVESGPLVRSSYRADEQVRTLSQLNHIRVRN
jgi:lipoic acid synthetase